MNVMDMFKSAMAPAPAPIANNAPAPSPAPNPNEPAPGPSPNALAPAPVDPMAAYSKMWDTPTEEGKAPRFNLDPKIVDDVVSKQDFMQGLDPAILAKVQAGDPSAMIEAIQHAGRQAYRASLTHGSTLTDRFVEAREGFNEKNVNTRVRGELTNQHLADTPNYSNPVVKQQLKETAERLQRQHPDTPPAEIARMTKDYFNTLVHAMSPAAPPNPASKGPTDWDRFFDTGEEESRA